MCINVLRPIGHYHSNLGEFQYRFVMQKFRFSVPPLLPRFPSNNVISSCSLKSPHKVENASELQLILRVFLINIFCMCLCTHGLIIMVYQEAEFATNQGGGRKRLPKFKFSAKFPIYRFTRDFTNTDKKIRKWLLYYVKNYFNRKSVEVQPCTPLEIMLNGFCLKIIR